mgnify:CR=1 FL=1
MWKLRGTADLYSSYDYGGNITKEHSICCLFTSQGYGSEKDSKEMILRATLASVSQMLLMSTMLVINSNKFNSGLFGVPWEDTEKILNFCLNYYPDQKWIVWEL